MKIVRLMIPYMETGYMMHLDEKCRIGMIGKLIYHVRSGKFLPSGWTVKMSGIESGDTLIMLMGGADDGNSEGRLRGNDQ